MRQTLVLNATYEVIQVVDWQKAITLICLEKVDIVEEYDECVSSPSVKVKVPAVIKYRKLIRPKYRALRFSKNNIYLRDNYTCQYCGEYVGRAKLTLDHIIPRSKNGKTDWANCVACCESCNIFKGSKSLKDAGMTLIKQPHQPSFTDCFGLIMRLKTETIPSIWQNYSLPASITGRE